MKYLLIATLLGSMLHAFELNLKLTGMTSKKGMLYIGLYRNASNFKKTSQTFRKKIVKAQKGTHRYIFHHLPKGTYAIAVFHDENSNGVLDTNFIGVPKEKYGFSNNKHFRLRSSSFEEASFELKKNKSIIIKMLD